MSLEELKKFLSVDQPSVLLRQNEEELFQLIPYLNQCKGCSFSDSFCLYDVYEHTLSVVDNVSNYLVLRLAALFHEIGKPYFCKNHVSNNEQYQQFWYASQKIFDEFADKNYLDLKLKTMVSKLILYQNVNATKLNEESFHKFITIFSKEEIVLLYQLKRASMEANSNMENSLIDNYRQQEIKILSRYK